LIDDLVEQIERRFSELQQQMVDPAIMGDRQRYAEVGREYRRIEKAHDLAVEYRLAADDAAGARELLSEDGDDPELRDLLQRSERRLEELTEEIRLAMVETDPADAKDVIVEIRPGTGGDEAGLFAGDLYRMLTRYAERRGFKVEDLSVGDGDYTFAVKGDGAYSVFKYEGGTHRVQRVPETESQGRIHTSTATVVRITHKPSGIVVSMQDEKSQLQNREKAMRVLRARLLERARAEQDAELAAARLSQVGSGERSEKIRTYNFPQDRVTDHRVKLTKNGLPVILAGELDDFTSALEADERRRRLEAASAGAT
jgi:peptide chain release factor 1